jgi:hypothetical protein
MLKFGSSRMSDPNGTRMALTFRRKLGPITFITPAPSRLATAASVFKGDVHVVHDGDRFSLGSGNPGVYLGRTSRAIAEAGA